MENCAEQVYSNDYFDFIIYYGDVENVPVAGACTQQIDDDYDIFYYPREGLPSLSVGNYTYSTIPKCFGLLDTTALESSGILRMQNQPALALKGNGVLVGFIDTGERVIIMSGIWETAENNRFSRFCLTQNVGRSAIFEQEDIYSIA